jgi:hypothetical protein
MICEKRAQGALFSFAHCGRRSQSRIKRVRGNVTTCRDEIRRSRCQHERSQLPLCGGGPLSNVPIFLVKARLLQAIHASSRMNRPFAGHDAHAFARSASVDLVLTVRGCECRNDGLISACTNPKTRTDLFGLGLRFIDLERNTIDTCFRRGLICTCHGLDAL